MNPFMYLLNQQAPSMLPVEDFTQGPPETVGNPLIVTGERSKEGPYTPNVQQNPYDDFMLGNKYAVQDVQEANRQTAEVSDRRGLFGMKGTLRDVLGILGDAFLVQSGKAPMYAPRRRQEQISDAWAGASKDPMAAAERVGYYDANLGQGMLDAAENREIRRAQAASLQETRQATADNQKFQRYKNAREQIGGLLQTPGAVVNGQISPQAVQIADRIARAAGLTLEEFMIAEGMSEEDVRNYASSVMDPYKQQRLGQYEVGLQQGQQRADASTTSAQASMIRAQRPPAGRAPAQPTNAGELARIRGLVNAGKTLSPGDQATWDKSIESSGSRSSGRKSLNNPSPSTGRFRPAR
jgi:hypothetical protein